MTNPGPDIPQDIAPDRTGPGAETVAERLARVRLPIAERVAAMWSAPRCLWCKRNALKGERWCHWHRPGNRKVARSGLPAVPQSAKQITARQETGAVQLAPPALLSWPPVRRILAVRPGERVPVGVRHLVAALAREAMGDSLAWPSMVAALVAAGHLVAGDPPRPAVPPGGFLPLANP